jgi:TATA-box binding protein (TBP) (component of TFIID and TFIIIB)
MEYWKTNHVIIVKTHGMRDIRAAFDELEYGAHTPNSFSALTLKHRNPSATIIMFSTGNITIMGPKTMWGAMYVLYILKKRFDLKIIHINVANVVVKFKQVGRSGMDINDLYNWNKKDCDCDEDLFPSCTYMVPGTTIKANFFNSGKVVVAGCSSSGVAERVMSHLSYVISNFYDNKLSVGVVDKRLVLHSMPVSGGCVYESETNKQNPNDNEEAV